MYQGGTNIAECITFGRIAGKNAAAVKDALPTYTVEAVESAPAQPGDIDDLVGEEETYETADNQYIGKAQGMDDEIVVRVTVDDGKISQVEVLKQNETEASACLPPSSCRRSSLVWTPRKPSMLWMVFRALPLPPTLLSRRWSTRLLQAKLIRNRINAEGAADVESAAPFLDGKITAYLPSRSGCGCGGPASRWRWCFRRRWAR